MALHVYRGPLPRPHLVVANLVAIRGRVAQGVAPATCTVPSM